MSFSRQTAVILQSIGNTTAALQEWIMKKKNGSNDAFGQRLTQLRLAKGFTQGELAERIGVSQRVLCYYERETEYPPAHLLPKIAEVLGISLDELMGLKAVKIGTPPGNSRLRRKLRLVETFPKQDQKAILRMIDAFASRTAAGH